ncbi:multiheme c-type cytochrome [Planctomycetaceae bacterium SH139]
MPASICRLQLLTTVLLGSLLIVTLTAVPSAAQSPRPPAWFSERADSPRAQSTGMPEAAIKAYANSSFGRPADAQQIPNIPAAAQAMLPPGCLDTWQAPQAVQAADVGPARLNGGLPSQHAASQHPTSPYPTSPHISSPHLNSPHTAATQMVGHRSYPAATTAASTGGADGAEAEDPHRAIFLESEYPSAMTCAKCHPRHFEDWRVSAHAYATISPMFQRFEQTLTVLSQGTVGAFCMRCHAPVATQASIPRFESVLDAPAVVREGITCVACHRVVESYGKTHGHRRIEPGDIHQPIVGGGDGSGVREAIAQKDKLKLKLDASDTGPGQAMHNGSIQFATISRSDFCLSCHQVAVHPGIWLEVVYSQYNASPARKRGITCQQCHFGAVPGKADGYECFPIAEINGKPFGEPKKYSNHMAWGPGYSIAHPGLFPVDEKGERWSPREWLRFDWQAGWGTEAFERAVYDLEGAQPGAAPRFPSPWDNADERRDARGVIDKRLESLARARAGSIAAMEAGADITGPFITQASVGKPLAFHYVVHNRSDGHNLPTGSLGAQPQVWLNVALVNPLGQTVWETGYLDTQGDLADMNSEDVANGIVPRDSQLFNLQTKFLITNVKGTDRELPLPVNVDVDQIPFFRPANVPVSVLNHPQLIRMEAHSIPALDHRQAKYRVPAGLITMRGQYRLDVRLRSRVEPSYFMRFVGSTAEMINRMNHQILDIHPKSYHFIVQ